MYWIHWIHWIQNWTLGPFYRNGWTWIDFNPSRGNAIHYTACDEIIYPFPNFNCGTVGVWGGISSCISYFTGQVITYPCWDLIYSILENEDLWLSVIMAFLCWENSGSWGARFYNISRWFSASHVCACCYRESYVTKALLFHLKDLFYSIEKKHWMQICHFVFKKLHIK